MRQRHAKKFINISRPFKFILSILIVGLLLGVCMHVFADGTDVLQGTTADATRTLSNSGKKWLYLIEGVAAIFGYIQTKNVFVFGGIAAVAIMVNIILLLAGS